MWPCQASTSHRSPSTGQAFGTSDRERRNWHDARMRTARGAGGGRRALQQDMEQFTAISTLRGIMFLSRGNVYHGSSEFARFHHFEKMLFSRSRAPFQGRRPHRLRWRASEKNKKKMESDGGASTRASTRATAARSAALLRPLRSAPLAERRRSSTRPGGRRGRRRPQQGAEAKGAARQAPRPGAARRRARRAKPSWPRSSAAPGSGAL